ncbi:TetR/AcrR family transcriptional regulator [Bacillus sonorensis]|uniref:TetR family transcriptional regulator n=2 Tax=Bacillus sonorensis TaxID=119858 RepID=M5P8J0_9BACI|nr:MULTISPECIES: TetR/AcrR family transcriptional regulator [Bacillus]TWK84360.1 hypothetical protein CHCC20335_4428 [Bacillus paralicheniformis]ASB89027.1 hypothetical protein S101395_02520 [Bacillus sonorensis]EME75749.1 TetR family transcriptional regulator [Bacillus sonorensis L12]MCZ0075185.1 TetR/AcrR family transcriptional regulator [Bacillus sonorensis]MCZ0093325.1 TetR/AcrR family transcriptional regulator [Bacillus sonorensis]
MESKTNAKRQLILNTAKHIILDHDFNALTLDAVAKQAGISKGGLLYHFPNKEALIKGLALFVFEEMNATFEKNAEADPIEAGKWTRALIEAARLDLEHHAELNVGVFAASLLDPDASVHISHSYQAILSKLDDDGIDPVTATIIRLAIDGLYYAQMLNVAPVEKEMRQEVIRRLLAMTKKEG